MTVLDEILAHKRVEVAELRAAAPLAEVRAQAMAEAPPRDFAAAIAGPSVRIIAEVKRASPSAGQIRSDADPAAVARAYEQAGAAAVSVLTDCRYFSGSLADLRAVKTAVRLPVLRKDFIIDPYQVYEARAAGADAILLIAGTMPAEGLGTLRGLAAALGMAVVVETHTDADVRDALAAGARIIGINNRNLCTLAVDLDVTRRLRPRIPPDVVVVSESGIETAGDVQRVCAAGINAVLVGTALMANPDPAAALRVLRLAAEETGPAAPAHLQTGGRHP